MVKLNNCVYLRVNVKTKTMMKYLLSLAAAFVLCCTMGFAQELVPVTVDYNNPKTYVVGGVAVNGNVHFGTKQIVDLSGLSVGMEVVVPGDDLTSIVKRLWNQRYFDNVSLDIFAKDSYSDTASLISRSARVFQDGTIRVSRKERRTILMKGSNSGGETNCPNMS